MGFKKKMTLKKMEENKKGQKTSRATTNALNNTKRNNK
jgi:hypothetical protein